MWEKAFESLKAEDKISLNVTRADKWEILEEVLSMVQGAEQTSRQKRWKWKNRKGEYVIIRDVFLKMVAWIERFKGIGDVIAQYDPGHAALPWAVARFVLQASHLSRISRKSLLMSHRLQSTILEPTAQCWVD